MATLGDRIESALEAADMSMKDLERALESEGVEGGSYANLHRLKSDKMERPSAGLLYGIASATGVNLAWLVAGDGPMLTEPDRLRDITSEAVARLIVQAEHPPAVLDAFHDATRRLVLSVRADPTEEEVQRAADLLADLARAPLDRLRHQLPLGSRQVQDFYVAQIHALTLIMPDFRAVDSMEEIIQKLEGEG